jgi:hypothetical protein
MFPNADTYYAALQVERAAMLRHAERRALLAEATSRPRPAPSVACSRAVTFRLDWLARAVRSLRRVPRPAHA